MGYSIVHTYELLQGKQLNTQPFVNNRGYYLYLELIVTLAWPAFSDHLHTLPSSRLPGSQPI